MRVLAIDPGADMGWAMFESGNLTECGLAHEPLAPWKSADLLVIERPQHYPGGVKCDPNDLITLAIKVGRVEAFVSARLLLEVVPRRWKGTVPKDIIAQRVHTALRGPYGSGPTQYSVFLRGVNPVPKGKQHNVIEAVGLGLWFLTMGPKVG